jgi:hypothetical protein
VFIISIQSSILIGSKRQFYPRKGVGVITVHATTRKDYFSRPFLVPMVEHLVGHEYLRQPCGMILVTRSDCNLVWKVWLKTENLALVGGNPHSFPDYLILLYFVYWFCFCCVFQYQCLPFKFGGAFSYIVPDLHHIFGIVFLVTLGTMCHFSLGVG